MTNQFSIVLTDFQPVLMRPPIRQEKVLEYTTWLLGTVRCINEHVTSPEQVANIFGQVQGLMNRFSTSPDVISQRQLVVIPPFVAEATRDAFEQELPPLLDNMRDDPHGRQLDVRLRTYREIVYGFLERVYAAETEPPDDVIHVSCTGFLSPSPVERFYSDKGWLQTTVTHSYQMGCYGAFPAVRMATGFLGSAYLQMMAPKKRIDIVHSELSSLHFNLLNQTPGNLITMSLFSDGLIKYAAMPLEEVARQGKHGVRVLALSEHLLPDSQEDMKLEPGPYRFDMYLSKNVPLLIQQSIYPFVVNLCRQAGIDFEAEKENLVFAVHPGGSKILDCIRDRLGICEEKMALSRRILHQYGNMASATVPHIWKAIVEDEGIAAGTKIVSTGFGPGLTTTGVILEKV